MAEHQGEGQTVVKIRFRLIPRSYKGGRRVYSHEEVTLNFPKDVHELLRFLRDQEIGIRGYREGDKVHLELWAKDDL
jgi:hypothetical protein